MGSLFRISVYAASESAAKTATNAAFARVETLNQICSDYLPESELTRLSRNGGMIVSADLFDVIQRSQHISQITGGAFDITVGHLTNLWRRSKRKGTLPTIEQLTEAKSLTDWECIKLDAKSQRITLTKSRMQLDLGGIAKGYAADAALKVLAAHGITSAAVAASGDFAIGDAPPGEQGWEISLRTFEAPEATDQLFKGISKEHVHSMAIRRGAPRFMLHDLRKLVATTGEKLQISSAVLRRILNHTPPRSDVLHSHYVELGNADVKPALEAIQNELCRLMRE